MSFDRAKTLESAQKYLAKGQIDRAVSEYERLVQADPKDSRLLLKLGDLYTRQGATRDASLTYRKVAEQYAEQGFFLKAVAVCKQVLKLDPAQIDVWERLGEMYEMLSLVSDAITTYEQVAETCTRANNPRKALRAMQKIAELDPSNVAARIRYAEALSKLNKPEEAAAAFHEGAELLKQQGRLDDYLKVGERLLFHQPDNHAFARELAAAYLDRNDAKHALVKLQACFNAEPKNLDTLLLLARAFEQLGQTAKTISVLKEVARLHALEARNAEQGSVLRRILALDPKDADARRDLSTLKRLPSEQSSAAIEVGEEDYDLLLEDDESNLVEEGPATGRREALDPQAQAKVERLLDECTVFIRYGLTDKMITQLQEVLRIDSRHIDAREKLKDAFIKARRPADAINQLIILADQTAGDDAERARAYLTEALRIDPNHEQAKRNIGALLLGKSQRPNAPSARGGAPEPKTAAMPRTSHPAQSRPLPRPIDEHPEESFASVIPDATAQRAAPVADDADDVEMELDDSAVATTLDEEDVVFVEEVSEVGTASEPAPSARARVDMDVEAHAAEAHAEPELQMYSDGQTTADEYAQADTESDAYADTHAEPGIGEVTAVGEDAYEVPEALREALEEIEFYLSQEMIEEAQATLFDALSSFPGHPLLLQRQAALSGGEPAEAEAAPAVVATRSSRPAAAFASEPARRAEPSYSVRPEAHSLAAPEPVTESRPSLRSMQPPSPGPSNVPSRPPVREDRSFELAQKLAEEVAPISSQSSAAIEVADVLAQFKQGVAKQVDKADAATHYDLGIAYMEMGLHGEAIEEFKLCLVDPTRKCTAHTMIGMSYVAKGDMDPGIEHLKLALSENPRPEEELGLWFELGNAYELLGKNAEALPWYEEVHARDPQFRDVALRIQRLSMSRTPEQEADEFDEMFDNMILKE